MMIKNLKRLICVLVLLPVYLAAAEKVITLPGVLAPAGVLVDDERIYVHESVTIHIFSASDYRFIKKFGRKGEGPGEFKLDDDNQVDVSLLTDPPGLLVNSVGRISYFTKDGKFIREKKNDSGRWLAPLGKSFVGMKRVYDDKNLRSRKVCLYNADLQLTEILYSEKDGIQPRLKTIDAVSWPSSAIYDTYRDKVLVSDWRNSCIYVYNDKGEKIHHIKLEYKRVKMTAELKKQYVKLYKEEDPYWRARWENLKKWFVYPEYLPVVWYFKVADEKIYIFTHKTKNKKQEILVLDMKGKLLKRLYLPMVRWDIMGLMPFTIKNDRLYQLVENEETEQCDLHMHHAARGTDL